MVTLLTSYTKQRYVLNAMDDPGDIVFRNGDTLFLMDVQQELIYSEDDNQWYQVPSAGGGGGGYEANDWLDLSKPTGALTSAIEMNSNSYILLAWHTGITSVTLTESTYIPVNFMRGCTALTAFSAPKASGEIGGGAFQNTTNLASLHLPNGKLSSDTCNNSGIVTGVFWGMNNNAVSNALRYCVNLERVDFTGNTGNVGSNTFQSTKLNTLVIRSTAVVGLSGVSVFNNSPFASGGSGGTLYVPQALISSYEAATNWSTILGYTNNQIKAIEGSIYENAYVDGVPIS